MGRRRTILLQFLSVHLSLFLLPVGHFLFERLGRSFLPYLDHAIQVGDFDSHRLPIPLLRSGVSLFLALHHHLLLNSEIFVHFRLPHGVSTSVVHHVIVLVVRLSVVDFQLFWFCVDTCQFHSGLGLRVNFLADY